jgi:hypothetical protein
MTEIRFMQVECVSLKFQMQKTYNPNGCAVETPGCRDQLDYGYVDRLDRGFDFGAPEVVGRAFGGMVCSIGRCWLRRRLARSQRKGERGR